VPTKANTSNQNVTNKRVVRNALARGGARSFKRCGKQWMGGGQHLHARFEHHTVALQKRQAGLCNEGVTVRSVKIRSDGGPLK
jgi:hypothetical protein